MMLEGDGTPAACLIRTPHGDGDEDGVEMNVAENRSIIKDPPQVWRLSGAQAPSFSRWPKATNADDLAVARTDRNDDDGEGGFVIL
jgi:hypothetical protein